MSRERVKAGWIAQAIIVGFGSTVGAVFGLELAPVDVGAGPSWPIDPTILRFIIASVGAVCGGLLFSLIKDR